MQKSIILVYKCNFIIWLYFRQKYYFRTKHLKNLKFSGYTWRILRLVSFRTLCLHITAGFICKVCDVITDNTGIVQQSLKKLYKPIETAVNFTELIIPNLEFSSD